MNANKRQAGAHFTRTPLRHLPDCPKCKFGTLDRKKVPVITKESRAEVLMWVCADCGHRFPSPEP